MNHFIINKRRLWIWAAVFLLYCTLGGCNATKRDYSSESDQGFTARPIQPIIPGIPTSAGRLLVLRFHSQGLQVLRNQPLGESPRQRRLPHVGRHGLWKVLGASNRSLTSGTFRLPRTVHALFGNIDGPAEGVSVENPHPVVIVRIPHPVGAKRVQFFETPGDRFLGEVEL